MDVIVHAASQVSHPKSIDIPMADFQINAFGTIRLLEAVRAHAKDPIFVYISTAKIYGENVDIEPVKESKSRYEYEDWGYKGIDESCSMDNTKKTPFGCSKAYADLITQEYGKMYGCKTSVLRPGCFAGQFTRPTIHQRWEAFLMLKALKGETIDVFGYHGKQVRDILHCKDLTDAIMFLIKEPPHNGAVFNIGGGKENAISVNEAILRIGTLLGKEPMVKYREKREGDWRVYITDNSKLQAQYKDWKVSKNLDFIFSELYNALTKELITISK